jgi:hypothetical protein
MRLSAVARCFFENEPLPTTDADETRPPETRLSRWNG